MISIHALREEGDKLHNCPGKGHVDFYPRPPRGGRHKLFIHTAVILNFYPRPPRGGRRSNVEIITLVVMISIHALREEGDLRRWYAVLQTPISIHALREEGDLPAP